MTVAWTEKKHKRLRELCEKEQCSIPEFVELDALKREAIELLCKSERFLALTQLIEIDGKGL